MKLALILVIKNTLKITLRNFQKLMIYSLGQKKKKIFERIRSLKIPVLLILHACTPISPNHRQLLAYRGNNNTPLS